MNRYDRAYKKSYDVAKIEYNEKKMLLNVTKVKKFLVVAGLVIAIASSSITGLIMDGIDNLNNRAEVKEYIAPYTQIVTENTHRTQDMQNYWYDTYDMASELLEDSETFQEKFYAVYKKIGYNDANKIKHLNEILGIMDYRIESNPDEYQNFTGYDSFDDLLIKNGYVDKEGNPSRDKYEEAMKSYILAKADFEEAKDNVALK